LIVDYMLTITISVASAGDQIFSFLPISTHGFKLALEFSLIFFLIYLNLRGTKESVLFLLPIFLLFVVAHIFAIGLGILPKAAEVPLVASTTYQNTIGDIQGLGLWATLFIVLHAYSLGGGTYTGIEAVSNGLQALRDRGSRPAKKPSFIWPRRSPLQQAVCCSAICSIRSHMKRAKL
jgi:amino acid transporter